MILIKKTGEKFSYQNRELPLNASQQNDSTVILSNCCYMNVIPLRTD